jgi:hypothetical protein
MSDICPSRDDAQRHIVERGRCVLCLAPIADTIDSDGKPCTCSTDRQACAAHGIGASNARENRYWQRVGRD